MYIINSLSNKSLYSQNFRARNKKQTKPIESKNNIKTQKMYQQ